MTLNRAEALAGVLISLVLAVLPVLGNFDWTSTAGVLAGIVAVLGIVAKRLDGWQKDEANEALLQHAALTTVVEPDETDPTGVKHTGLPS